MAMGARQAGAARGRSGRLAGAFSVLVSWYYQPYVAPGNGAVFSSPSPLSPGLFDLRGLAFAGWTLAAFAIGALAGMLIRRIVPAIVATLAAYAGLALLAANVLRQHYLTPLVAKGRTCLVPRGSRASGGPRAGKSRSVADPVSACSRSSVHPISFRDLAAA